jgi:hypothetical protein
MDVLKNFQYTDDQLQTILLSQEQLLGRTLRNLEDELIDSAHKYLAGLPGGTKFELQQGLQLHIQIIKIFEQKYNMPMAALSGNYSQVEKLIKKHFKNFNVPVNYATIDNQMMNVLKKLDFDKFEAMGVGTREIVTDAVTDAAIVGHPFSLLQKQIAGAVRGHKDVLGRSLASYAHTYAQDSLMDYYSKIHLMKANDAGLNKFLYYGNTMNESRPFCISMLGRTLTMNEIKKLNGLSWAGKAPGDVFTKRGGYNCRHHWVAIDPDWITEQDQQHFDKEQKRHTKKLDEKEVEKVTAMEKQINKIVR